MRRHSLLVPLGLILAVTAAFLQSPLPVAAWTAIDSFSSAQDLLVYPPTFPNPNSNWLSDSAVLGGERDLYASRASGGSLLFCQVNSAESHLTYVAAGGVTGYVDVVWDGPDNDGAVIDDKGLGVGGEDLTSQGQRFQVSVKQSDHAGATLAITVWDIDGDSDTVTTASIPEVPAGTPVVYNFPFTGFDNAVDFSRVGAIQLRIDGTGVADLNMDIDWIAIDSLPTAVRGLALSTENDQSLPLTVAGTVVVVSAAGALVVTRVKRKREN